MDIDMLADALRDGLHSPMHDLNGKLKGLFGQEDDDSDLNKIIERGQIFMKEIKKILYLMF